MNGSVAQTLFPFYFIYLFNTAGGAMVMEAAAPSVFKASQKYL